MFDLVDQVADALVAVAPDGRVVQWSGGAERMFGYARGEAIERLLVDLIVAPDHRAEERERYAQAEVAGELTFEAARVRKDGARVHVDVSIRAVQAHGFAISMKDIGPLRRGDTAAALRLASKELEAFGHSIAHDLRAPLRGMNGFAQILIEDFGPQLPADARDHLEEIRSNAARMGQLIDALVGLSRVSRSELHREDLDLGAIARRIAKRQTAEHPDRTVELVLTGELTASADPTLARTLLDALLDNAWKFTRATASARVELGAADDAGARTFFVRDNGAGFDMAFADRLFGPFRRLHPEREFPGTGIGLATAQRIVHRHGGRIWADGQVGRGATFRFTLPEGAGR